MVSLGPAPSSPWALLTQDSATTGLRRSFCFAPSGIFHLFQLGRGSGTLGAGLVLWGMLSPGGIPYSGGSLGMLWGEQVSRTPPGSEM